MIHQALTYGSDAEFVERLVPFLADGLRTGDHAIMVTPPARLGLLRDALGPAARTAEFIDAHSWYDAPGRTLRAYHRRIRDHPGPGRLRVVGEPVWAGRDSDETTEWTRYESLINVVFASTSAWIVCPYDTREVPATVVADAARTHPELLTAAGTRPAGGYADPEEFYAECNASALPPAPASAAGIGFGPGGLAAVRHFTERFARNNGLLNGRLGGFVAAVNEVATNVLHHGGGSGSVLLWTDSRGLMCDVIDPVGRLDDRFLGHLPPDPGDRRPAGLWAARQLADLVQIRTGDGDGITVRLRLSVPAMGG